MMHSPDFLSSVCAAPILVVDDDPISLSFVKSSLVRSGFQNIITLSNGDEAVDYLARFQPDLVIMDIHMPGRDGLAVTEWIRRQSSLHDLPVLVLTSLGDERLRYKSFELGATDFVSKPVHPNELHARAKVHLEQRLGLKQLQAYHTRCELELQKARELQLDILPSATELLDIKQRCGIDIASHLNSSSEVGGDFWGMKSLFPHQTAFWTVDFSGHGVAAALNAFRLQAYLKESSDLATRSGDYMAHMNEKLLRILTRGHFATMFYGIADTKGNQLYYACACTPHPIIMRKDGAIHKLDGGGVPLGVCMEFYPTQSVDFNLGDTLVLYSDAFVETVNQNGECIAEDVIVSLLQTNIGASAEKMRDELLWYFSRSCGKHVVDDLTLCVIQRVG